MSPSPPRKLTRRAALSMAAAAGAAIGTPARAQFSFLQPQQQPPGGQPGPGAKAGLQNRVVRGYSERFQSVRQLIAQGRYSDAADRFAPAGPKPANAAAAPMAATPASTGGAPAGRSSATQAGAGDATSTTARPGPIVSDAFLANAELGLIQFEGGQADQALASLRAAEDSLTAKPATTKAGSIKNFAGGAGRLVLGKVTGQEELGAYHPLDHELILEMNYLALAYLLQGERRCYNVARRCMDQQAALKVKFDKEIEDYKAKYAQKTDDKAKVSDKDRAAIDSLQDQFQAFDDQANRVPNAYVNPLGDYLAGLIQEVVSREQPALRDNSRIAYANASKLCGGSAQLTAAAAAMARARPPARERVVHLIVGEGFSPERQVMTFGLNLQGQVVPIRVPIFTPVPSPIERLEVLGARGVIIAKLDPIGDFEAIRLRDQHDRLPEIMLGVFTSSLASYFEGQALDKMGIFGQVIHLAREATAAPDTRSWLSLPRRFHVARFVVPAALQSISLVARDAKGERVGSQDIPLLTGETQSIVYARATADGLQIQAARKLWIDGGRLEETET